MTESAIVALDPNAAILGAKARYQTLKNLTMEILVEGIDYGTIPGTDKPCLYKAGSEKLCSTFGFDPRFEILDKIENFSDENGLFHYTILCRLIHIGTGAEIATGIGSCNSKENRYRWRWVREDEVPHYLDKKILRKRNGLITEPEFAIDKAETTGKYGKPTSYWAAFEEAMANGTAIKGSRDKRGGGTYVTWSIGGDEYRIPNDEVFTLANTIQKMACKRALVAATLIGTNASEFYSQDLEDMADFGADFIVGKATPAPEVKKIIVDDVDKTTTTPDGKPSKFEEDLRRKKEAETKEEALKAEAEAKEKAIKEEQEAIMRDMVGEGKKYATVAELKARMTQVGYASYAAMRSELTFEEAVEALGFDDHDADKFLGKNAEPNMKVKA